MRWRRLVLLGFHLFADALLELDGLGTQLVVVQFLNLGINLKSGIEEGFHFLQVSVGLGAKQFG